MPNLPRRGSPAPVAPPRQGGEPLAAGVSGGGGCAAFGVVIANILAGPLVALAPRLAGYAAPGAALALSGVLAGPQVLFSPHLINEEKYNNKIKIKTITQDFRIWLTLA